MPKGGLERFTNGQETLLQNLQCGQRVDVVSLARFWSMKIESIKMGT
jgi:hypothetical protein